MPDLSLVFDAREPAADAALGGVAGVGPRATSTPRRTRRRSPGTWVARRRSAAAFAAAFEGRLARARRGGAARGDRAVRAHRGGLGADHELCRAALLPEHHRSDRGRSSSATCRTALTDVDHAAGVLHAGAEPARRCGARRGCWPRTPALARYKPVLDRIRAMRPHQLSDELEKFLHDKSVVGAAAWNRLFDETHRRAALRGRRRDADARGDARPAVRPRPGAARRRRPRRCGGVPGDNLPLFSLITNTLAKDKEIEDRWRKLPAPQIGAHTSPTWSRTRWSTRCATRWSRPIPRLSHRYYALKAKWLGLEKLQVWDRNAPLPERRRPHDRLGRGARDRARRLCRLHPRTGGRSAGAVLRAAAGSTRRRGRARRRAPSPIRRCRRRIPICC